MLHRKRIGAAPWVNAPVPALAGANAGGIGTDEGTWSLATPPPARTAGQLLVTAFITKGSPDRHNLAASTPGWTNWVDSTARDLPLENGTSTAGYAEYLASNGTNLGLMSIWWRIATNTADDNITIEGSSQEGGAPIGVTGAYGVMMSFNNTLASWPFGRARWRSPGQASSTAGTKELSTSGPNSIVCYLALSLTSNAVATPSGYTEQFDAPNASAGLSLALGTRPIPRAGTLVSAATMTGIGHGGTLTFELLSSR